MEYENFIGIVREAGNGSKEITLPINITRFLGIKSGDTVKVMIKKVVDENEKDWRNI